MKVPAMLFSLVALCFLAGISCAAERARVTLPQTRPLTAACVLDAARAGGLPAAALFGILATEGGKTGEALRNTNGTWDRFKSIRFMSIRWRQWASPRKPSFRTAASMRMRQLGCCAGNTCVPETSGRPSAHITPEPPITGMPIWRGYGPIWRSCITGELPCCHPFRRRAHESAFR